MKLTCEPRSFLASILLALAIALVGTPKTTSAQTFTLLHTFSGTADGATPQAPLIMDSAGNLYGTTVYGGSASSGIVFKIDQAGNETILYTFSGGADGQYPVGGLLRDKTGNLFGTTYDGGTGFNFAGTVFKLAPSGKEKVLYNFNGEADGGNPLSGLIADSGGNLYGSTEGSGASGFGTIFKISPAHHETVLYSFPGGKDGSNPSRGYLIRDRAGNIHGTATLGGVRDNGLVYTLVGSDEGVIHRFSGGSDGGFPYWNLTQDSAGNFYGTTWVGGTFLSGTVFKISRTGSRETVLYNFTGGADGKFALGGVVCDSQGNLFGTTNSGGAFGFGTVYKVDANGNETVLYSFTGGADGASPQASLILDSGGNLYGTATKGGTGNGTVFKITP